MSYTRVTSNTLNTTYVDVSLRSIPSLEGGDIRISQGYDIFKNPYQDTIMIMGHADPADGIFEPQEVINVQETINYLGANQNSPLIRSLFELLDMGCQNIVIYPVAPMSEYVSEVELSNRFEVNSTWDTVVEGPIESEFPSLSDTPVLDWNNNNFYQRYYNRLQVAYSNLVTWGELQGIEILLPIEAPFYDTGSVDFLGQLIDLCHTNFTYNGNVAMGMVGTRIENFNQSDIDTMVADARLDPVLSSVYTNQGKYVMIVAGEGIISHKGLSLTHRSSLSIQAAGKLAITSLDRSISGMRLPGCINLTSLDLTKEQASVLAESRINPVVRTSKGKRGFAFETRLLTDNTVSKYAEEDWRSNASRQGDVNYWSMSQMHVLAGVINQIRQYGEVFIGERISDADNFKRAVEQFLNDLLNNGYIRNFSLNFETVTSEYKLIVNVGLQPIFGIRNIYFQVDAGPLSKEG